MSVFNKVLLYLLGILLVFAGSMVALDMINISINSIMLLIIGTFSLLVYKKWPFSIFKYISCIFIPIGTVIFVISTFKVSDEVNFLLLYSSFVCAFFALYIASKCKFLLYLALGISLFAAHVYTNAQSQLVRFIVAYDLFYISALSVVLYVFEHKSTGHKPLFISIIAYLCGLFRLLNIYGFISLIIYKLFISVMLVLVGAFIIGYMSVKSNKNSKENTYE